MKPETLKAFESVPDLYLILSPDLIIQTASYPYLEATLTQREGIQGKHLFDAFPENPELPELGEIVNLQHSFEQVVTESNTVQKKEHLL